MVYQLPPNRIRFVFLLLGSKPIRNHLGMLSSASLSIILVFLRMMSYLFGNATRNTIKKMILLRTYMGCIGLYSR